MSDQPAPTILIIDDEVFSRDHLARIIERHGFRTLNAATGEEGIRMYRECRPDFVFLDVLLPGLDGKEVFRYIREGDPQACVYFLTACDDMVSQDEAQTLGAKGFFTKPLFIDEVLKLLVMLKSGDLPDFYSSGNKMC